MKRARFLAPARLEYFDEIKYYSRIRDELGLRFIEAVEEASERALAFPLAGSPCESGTRRFLLKKFPFSMVYRVEDDGILIVAIAAHSKKPGYWISRVEP